MHLDSTTISHNVQEGAIETGGEEDYPAPLPLTLLTIGLCLAVFLLSTDRTIVTTAIPYITNDFHSFAQFGWYGSAYLITSSVFQPLFGRVFQLFDLKWTYVASLLIFEVGSVVCAAAPTSTALIVGRAITGFGSAGIVSGSFVIGLHVVPLHKRPIYTACVGIL